MNQNETEDKKMNILKTSSETLNQPLLGIRQETQTLFKFRNSLIKIPKYWNNSPDRHGWALNSN